MNSRVATLTRDWNNSIPYVRHYLSMPSALGWRVGAAAFGLYVVAQVLIDRGLYGGDLLPWVQAAVLLQVAVLAVLLAGGWVIFRRPVAKWTPLAVVFVYAMAQVARGLVAGMYAVRVAGADELELLYRCVYTLPSGITTGIGLAVLFGAREEHRLLMLDLADKRQKILGIRTGLAKRLEQSRLDLVRAIQERLAPSAAELESALQGAHGAEERAVAIGQIQSVLEHEIRPISRSLELQVGIPAQTEELPRVKEKWPPSLGGSQLFFPKAATIWITALNFSQIARVDFSLLPLSVLAVQGLAVWWLLELTEALLDRRQLPTLSGVLLASVGTGLVAVSAAQVQRMLPDLRIPGLIPANFIVSAVIGMALAVFAVVSVQRAATEKAWTEAVNELRLSTNLLEQRQWVITRRLRHLVHGTLQGAFVAAAIKLANAAQVDERVLNEIRGDIRSALEGLIDVGEGHASVDHGISALQDSWRGVCLIVPTVSEESKAVCDADASLAQCVVEVIVEAVGNAVRHGRATRCEIVLRVDGELLALTVSDNGIGPAEKTTPGLGTQCFDEVTMDWRLSREGRLTVLACSFALADSLPVLKDS